MWGGEGCRKQDAACWSAARGRRSPGRPPPVLACPSSCVCVAPAALRPPLAQGLKATFFNADTPAAIKARQESGRDQDLKDVLKAYKVRAARSCLQCCAA